MKNTHRIAALALALCLLAAMTPCALADAKLIRTPGNGWETVTVTLTPEDLAPAQTPDETPASCAALQVGEYVLFAYCPAGEGAPATRFLAYTEHGGVTGFFPVTLTLAEDGLRIGLAADALPETEPADGAALPVVTDAADGTALAVVYTSDGAEIRLPLVQSAGAPLSMTRRIIENVPIPHGTVYRNNTGRYADEGPVTVQRGVNGNRQNIYIAVWRTGSRSPGRWSAAGSPSSP